jgi:hypothetical protein
VPQVAVAAQAIPFAESGQIVIRVLHRMDHLMQYQYVLADRVQPLLVLDHDDRLAPVTVKGRPLLRGTRCHFLGLERLGTCQTEPSQGELEVVGLGSVAGIVAQQLELRVCLRQEGHQGRG